MEGPQSQASLQMLQSFSAPVLQQQQTAHVQVVLPAVWTQRPGVQVFQQSSVDDALVLLVPNSRAAILQYVQRDRDRDSLLMPCHYGNKDGSLGKKCQR